MAKIDRLQYTGGVALPTDAELSAALKERVRSNPGQTAVDEAAVEFQSISDSEMYQVLGDLLVCYQALRRVFAVLNLELNSAEPGEAQRGDGEARATPKSDLMVVSPDIVVPIAIPPGGGRMLE